MDDHVTACSLNAGKLDHRVARIASLNARSLRSAVRDDLRLTLDYDPAAIEDIRKIVADEQRCCAFVDFKLIEHPEFVRILIVAPEAKLDAAEALFELISSGVRQQLAKPCGCTGECGA